MASGRDIKRRITSVKNTRQITKAMKMVAAAKLRRAQEAVVLSRPYAQKMRSVMGKLTSSQDGSYTHPMFQKRAEKNVLIVVFSSDKGLCGAFNSNLFKTAMRYVNENSNLAIHVSSVGKKGRDFFRRRNVTMQKCWVDFSRSISYEYAANVAKDITEMFTSGKVDKVYVLYNRFKTVMSQDVVFEQLLPISSEGGKTGDGAGEKIFEPSAEEVFSAILEKNVEFQIYQGILESWASFNGSQMVAMDSATRNAGEMIDALTLEYNRARQSAITKELIEIVSGADALKG
ncbi:MAG: ATP synthase F1 subunit gamma [Nitrospinae bacterium]|nr:ATP synthase F1 subunit gamma [Nitrospinota bacterium]